MPRVLKGRYRLRAEIGQGGMGVVWQAFDERLGREVAVKLLHPWIAQDSDSRVRFDREARTLGRLTHQHIVRIYDFEEAGQASFLVMELIAGHDLTEELASRAPMPWSRARSLLAPVCDALTYAHEHGVIHRDLKPANILRETGGRIVVSDFGLARLVQTSQSITATGVLVGTPYYWSPEQAAGEPITQASDLYSFGCVLHEGLTGQRPFEGEDPLAAGYRRVHEAAADPRTHVHEIPDQAAELVNQLLRRSPGERPTAREVADVLADATALSEDRETVRLVDEPPTQILPTRSSTRKWILVGVALLLAAAAFWLGIAMAQNADADPNDAPEAAEPARIQVPNLIGSPSSTATSSPGRSPATR